MKETKGGIIMHMADALVAPAVAGTMYVCSGAAAVFSMKKMQIEKETEKLPLMGVMGAFVFAAQMINFTIPGTGSSGHLCGGMMLSALLGPLAGFLTMIGILVVQCLLFADGGLLALGCNIWNMAFYGCFIGALCIWEPLMKHGISKKKITFASIAGCVLTLQLGAFSVVMETLLSGITELPFAVFAGAMQPIHLAIGLVEGLITAAVLSFVYEARPELLWTGEHSIQTENKKSNFSYRRVLGIFMALTVFVGGGLSLFASANPDGLEWSIQKLTGSTEIASGGKVHTLTGYIQKLTALFPDYGLKHSDSQIGTSISGIIGGIIVMAVCIGGCLLVKKIKGNKMHE